MTTDPVATPAAPKGTHLNWIVLLVLGALSAGLGLFLSVQPASAARLLVQGVGIYWLVAGLVELVGILADRCAPMGRLRLVGATGATLSGALVVLSMFAGQFIALVLTRYIAALTALLMGVINLVIGLDRSAPSRGRQGLGVVYALLGVALLVDPMIVPTFVLPLIGVLLLAAGGYAMYAAYMGRTAGAVRLGLPSPVALREAPTGAKVGQARSDIERIAQQAKDSPLGPREGP